MLLFCYVNLMVLNKDKTSIGEFLESNIQEDMENEEVEEEIVEDPEEGDSTDADTDDDEEEDANNMVISEEECL